MEKAVQLLLKAIETDPNSGAAWYLIGRWVEIIFVYTKHNNVAVQSEIQVMYGTCFP